MENTTISEFNNQKIVVNFYHGPQEQETEPEVFMDKIFTSRKYRRWNETDLACLKETNPTVSQNDLECLSVELTLNELLGPTKYEEIIKSVASTQSTMSQAEAQSMYVLVDLLKKKPEYLMSYVYNNGIFPGLLFKKKDFSQPNALSLLEDILKQNPRWPVELVMATLSRSKKYPDNLSLKLDHWLFSQLKNINLRKQSKNKEFIEDLASYLRYGSKNSHEVCCLVCSKIDVFCERDQCLFWDQILCKNTTPEKQQAAVLAFLETIHSAEVNKNFYHQVRANIPALKFEEILANASDTAKKNYFQILKEQKQELTEVCIKKDGERKFLCWDLYEKEKISDKEMMEIIQKYDSRGRTQPAKRSFLFQDKNRLNWNIFEAGCRKFKSSPLLALMWISSFSKMESFGSSLASSWEALPPEIRQNPNIQLTMDNRFDLLYQFACSGNTSMMNEIMKTMKDKYPDFIRRLMSPHEDGNTCLHQLCRHSKKGLLKLLDKLPEAEQQCLLSQKNDMGQSPLDLCSDDFRRFLDQKNFIRPQQTKVIVDSIKPEESEKNVQELVTSSSTNKETFWHPLFETERYKDERKKLQTNSDIMTALNREITRLRRLSPSDLQRRARQDLKRHFKSRISVAKVRSLNHPYRLGYVVQDGQICLLFIMTHQQYDNELQGKGPLDACCQNVRNLVHQMAIERQKQKGRS